MNLTEIEKAVVELSLRHPSLTKEFLRTLLEASGWEEKHIKEAQIIFTAHLSTASASTTVATPRVESLVKSVGTASLGAQAPSTPVESSGITFLRPDGTEEGELRVEEANNVPKREIKENKITSLIEKATDVIDIDFSNPILITEAEKGKEVKLDQLSQSSVMTEERQEEQSLIKDESLTRQEKTKVWSELPDNLPLVPFESAPHVWSFSRYKDTFHREEKQEIILEEKKVEAVAAGSLNEEQKKESLLQVSPIDERTEWLPAENLIKQVKKEPEVEIEFEKVPITKGEESLVVLAGIMLLAIMLILGYMYGNGRL